MAGYTYVIFGKYALASEFASQKSDGANSVWMNANATEHMGEYISRIGGETASSGVRSQIMLESYNASLNKAMLEISSKAPDRHFGIYANWELGINTETGVVYHARMIK